LGQKNAIPELHRHKEYAMGQCPEYPWPDAMRGESETDLVDMPDI